MWFLLVVIWLQSKVSQQQFSCCRCPKMWQPSLSCSWSKDTASKKCSFLFHLCVDFDAQQHGLPPPTLAVQPKNSKTEIFRPDFLCPIPPLMKEWRCNWRKMMNPEDNFRVREKHEASIWIFVSGRFPGLGVRLKGGNPSHGRQKSNPFSTL